MINRTLQDIQELLPQKRASQSEEAIIQVWDYYHIFTHKNEYQKENILCKKHTGDIYLKSIQAKQYACKVMRQGSQLNLQEVINLFYQKIETFTSYNSEQILQLKAISMDISDNDYIFCCFTDYQKNGNLRDALLRGDLFTQPEPTKRLQQKYQLILQIAEGIKVIHDAGKSHNNLKTESILLDEHLKPKITGLKPVNQMSQLLESNKEQIK